MDWSNIPKAGTCVKKNVNRISNGMYLSRANNFSEVQTNRNQFKEVLIVKPRARIKAFHAEGFSINQVIQESPEEQAVYMQNS